MQVTSSLGGRTAEQGVAAVVAAAREAQAKKNVSGSCREWKSTEMRSGAGAVERTGLCAGLAELSATKRGLSSSVTPISN